ncbi:MAG TPA: virulence RhuM family protein [Caldisericia bacterium]|nr:virulence RhuM family protein [Caldisericia bacterium]
MTNKMVPPPEGQLLIYHDGALNVQVRIDGQTVWLTQRGMAELYQVTTKTINEHLVNIYIEYELNPAATIRKFRIVQIEGERQVSRIVEHYNLDAILAVGYRVRSARGTAFRQWATARLSELLVKGFTLDDERIKAGRTLGDEYFDELLERIRDIRSSERLFYQKITDIYATSIDYDPKAEITKTFYATVQNKLHWAIHGHTASEIVLRRANASKPNMGLTTWKNAPEGRIRKTDAVVAKNYLTQEELQELNRIVSMYLDYAEDQARRKKPMHMADWTKKLDAFLEFNERNILENAGNISHQLAEEHARAEFDKYDAEKRRLEAESPQSDFDMMVEEAKKLEKSSPPPRKPGKSARQKKDGGK